MAQQINLLSPAFQKPRDWLTLKAVAAAALGTAGLMVLLGAWLAWQLAANAAGGTAGLADGQAAGAGSADGGLQQAQAQVAELKARLAERRRAMADDMRRVREVEQAIARVQQALRPGGGSEAGDAAAGGRSDDDAPYSDYFEALAHQAHGSLWITGFSVSADGRQLELRGQALDVAVLPDYLSRLNAEPLFKGRRFDHLSLGRTPAEGAEGQAPASTEFVLRTGGVVPPNDAREARP